jgi:four helix bundle protein
MASKIGLEDRLIQFATTIIGIAEALPSTFAANHLAHQLVRSGTSPALNYAEAQGAESRPDFIHKLKISLKELRETHCCLRIIELKSWIPKENLSPVLNENNQLIAIFVKSILTAHQNNKPHNPKKQSQVQ